MEITSPSPSKTDHAIQDLIDSCRVQVPDGSNGQSQSLRYLDVKHACDELLSFTFHSEDGKLQVIEKLTKLEGNFVVKIIRKGLSGLSKVYSEARTFEEESLKLVELCCSQSEALQNGCEDGGHVASPAIIIDWMAELCDELLKTKEDCSCPQSTVVLMSSCLSKLRNMCETIVRAKLRIERTSTSINTFKGVFEFLKPRIQFDGFEELIEQTAAIVRTEEKLDFLKLSRIVCTLKQAFVLTIWLDLLKNSFLPNWWIVEIAKHDFLVNDEVYVQSLSFNDIMTYFESLICQVAGSISLFMRSVNQSEFSCHKEKAKVFFDHSEVFLRHTLPCLQLSQSKEISTNLIKDVFYTLGIKLDRALLPVITDSDIKDYEIEISPDVNTAITQLMSQREKHVKLSSFQQKLMSQRREYQNLSFKAITEALLTLPDKQQVLNVIQIWKQTFTEDTTYRMLSELFLLVDTARQGTEESMSNNMERLVTFLSHLPTERFSTLSVWQPLLVPLMTTLPHSWNSPEVVNLLRHFVDLHPKYLTDGQNIGDLGDASAQKLAEILNFTINILQSAAKSEEVKIEVLKLGLELFEEVPHPEEYQFVLMVILSIASDIETNRIKTYVLSLLKAARVHSSRIPYAHALIWSVINLIDDSCCIKRKSEVLESYLHVLQEIREVGLVHQVLNVCYGFLQLSVSVNTDNTKRFFALAAKERLHTSQFVLSCLILNKNIILEDRVDEHIIFLFNIVENTPGRDNCDLLFTTLDKYMQLQIMSFSSIGVFEVVLASIAGSIVVDTFDRNRNEAILTVVHTADHSHQLHQLDHTDVLSFSMCVGRIIDQAKCFGKKESFVDNFAKGLCLIAKLPLPLERIIQLMGKVTTMLDQEKITDENELLNVMFHLFQLPDNESTITPVDPNDLDAHFEKVLNSAIVRNVSKIPLMSKEVVQFKVVEITRNVSKISLMQVLVERMPKTFTDKTSASLYQFLVQRVKKNPQLFISVFPVVEAITKRGVSEAELKSEIEEIEETLLRVSPTFVPFIGECLRECYIVGLNEEQSIKGLILQILESLGLSNLNIDDGWRMIGSILDIPKQLVLTFKEAASPVEARKGMARIYNVVSKLDPTVITGSFCKQELKGQLEEIIQHDFNTLLRQNTVTVVDLCTALNLYPSLKLIDLLTFNLSRNEDFKSFHTELSSGTKQFEALTPGNFAYLVIQQLRRLKIPDTDIKDTTLEICGTVLHNYSFGNFLPPILPPKEYFDLFFVVMKESSYLFEIRHWLKIEYHLAVQNKSVITAACSWKSGNKSCEEALRMNDKVSETLAILKTTKVLPLTFMLHAGNLENDLIVMALVIKTCQDEEIAYKLLELLCTSSQCTETCLDIVPLWSKEESLLLINKITNWDKERQIEARIPLQVLPYAAKAFPNSAKEVFDFLMKITERDGPDDHLSLGRLPVWDKQMTGAGYDSQAIQSWCTSLVITPYICSSDVDSIANLTPEVIHLLSNMGSNEIKKRLFCLEATQYMQTDEDYFKRCLLLARLLNEFACIAGQLKENVKVVQRIKEGVQVLCSSFVHDTKAKEHGNMYKIRYNVLKDLFVLLFEGEIGEHTESLKQLTQGPLSKSLVILFRRLARSVVTRPITFSLIKSVVNTMLNHNLRNPSCHFQEIQDAIHETVLQFEANQDAIHTLQAAGYNQSTATWEDLWYSPSIQMLAYVPTDKSFGSSRKESLLRQLWREWKTILSAHGIPEVEVSGENLKLAELFESADSLETMERQLVFVQQAIRSKPLKQNNWSYYRQKQLLRSEKRIRKNIDEQVKQVKEMTGTQLTKMVLVLENQLLESVKVCSEKIPDCYAPNGFHSEKPVICGIAVDNRILTLYKQDDGGTRTEVENAEVKLYPSGMVVFGVYRNVHPYETEELWAAFYKMLLDKRLVPKIFITNISPAFDWIKQFVAPETSVPSHFSFNSSCGLIPSSEDSFDYDPDICIHRLHTTLANASMKELIILTQEKAKEIKPSNIKAPVANRKSLIKEQMDEVENSLKHEDRLQEMHPELNDREKIIKRLKTPIRKAVEIYVDGGEPTEESISRSIDMRRLLSGMHSQDAQQQYSKEDYSAIILVAVKRVTEDLRGNRSSGYKVMSNCKFCILLFYNLLFYTVLFYIARTVLSYIVTWT